MSEVQPSRVASEPEVNPEFLLDPYLQSISPAAVFTKPQVVAHWTKQSDRAEKQILPLDSTGLRVFTGVRLPVNVLHGYPERYIAKDKDDCGKVYCILEAMKAAGVDPSCMDVITFRNNLNKIGLTPLNPKDRWMVRAVYVHSTLLLQIVQWPQKEIPEEQQRYMYYGYKFEDLCGGAKMEDVVDSTADFGVVASLRIGELKVAMGAEIDTIDEALGSKDQLTVDSFVEIKTARHAPHKKARDAQYKYPKWWLQSYLAGVPRIALGTWNDNGDIQDFTMLATESLPELAYRQLGRRAWDAQIMLNFISQVLAWMKRFASAHEGKGVEFCCEDRKVAASLCTQVESDILVSMVLPYFQEQ